MNRFSFRVTDLLLAGASALVATAALAQECIDCHEEATVVVDSAHGFLDCGDCHPGFASPHDDGSAAELAAASPPCADCHEAAVTEFEQSAHGVVGKADGATWLNGCESCHGEVHQIVASSEPRSPTYPARVAATCGECHADPERAEQYRLRMARPLQAYQASVHGQAITEGSQSATCSACHGSHLVLAAGDPRSPVNRRNVSQTCGQCHRLIAETYRNSIHGQAAEIGINDSPVCTDCHGEHRILSPTRKDSPVYASNIPRMTCGRCHGDLRLSEKFGLAADSVRAYEDSYHGLVARAGAVRMAQCASCHGVHDILPSSDPASHVHQDNLAATCGQCHPGAGRRFAIGPVHVLPTQPEHRAVYLIRLAYLWVIFTTIGAMLVHNGLDCFRKLQHRHRLPPPAARAGPERMSLGFRIEHALLAGSFVVLAYSGFALKSPESWWASPLVQWEDTISFRGGLHRVAALVMILAFALHALQLIRDSRARACIREMLPNTADVTEFRSRVGYLLGLRSRPPHAAWLGYGEKIEYLAVLWGSGVMTVTGFVLWFEDAVLRWLPSLVSDVATVIHFYEAVLAVLAILVWHLYAVVFDPLVYPMDTAWLTGRSAPGREAERKRPGARFRSESDRVAPRERH